MHFQGTAIFQKRLSSEKKYQWEIVVMYILNTRRELFDDFYSSAKI